MAGARILGGVDSDPTAMKAYVGNFPGALWAKPELAERVDLRELRRKVGRVDLLLASPECTNHTHARGAAPIDDESRRKAFEVARYAEALSPRWVVVENVVNMQAWESYFTFIAKLELLGYKWKATKLNAADFAVPQARRRLFVVFDRQADPPSIAARPDMPRRDASDVIDIEGEYRWTPLIAERRAQATIDRAARARSHLGDGVPFLLVYYGTDKAGGWQPLDVPLRTVTTIDRFAVVKWVGGDPYMRMLQPTELLKAMGLVSPVEGRMFTIDGGTRRDKIRLLGNAVCAPVMQSVVSQLCQR